MVDAPHRLLKAKKAFGQNFLVNEGVIKLIVAAALDVPAERVLEIGPGPGVLTERLLADGRPLWAVELDPEAIALLRSRNPQEHFHPLLGDAVKAPLPDGPAWTIVGNLPYNAATPILTRFLTEPIPWVRMVLMFQREVGMKLMGHSGTKDYGPLSVLSQLCGKLTRLATLGPGSFRPSPKVDSVVVQFDPHPEAPDLETRRRLLSLLHRAFTHRRKTLSNTLGAEGVGAAGLDPSLRPEALDPAQWLQLVRHWPHGL